MLVYKVLILCTPVRREHFLQIIIVHEELFMEEKNIRNNEEMEIDLQRVFGVLLSKAWLIGLVAVVCAVAVFLGTFFLITPTYKSSAMFYVNNSALNLGEAALSISTGDINASRGLVQSYLVILNTRESLNAVIDYAGVNRTFSEVRGMITAEAVDDTEIFRVTVTSEDPQEAEKIASAIAYILPKRISRIIEGTSAKIVDSAVVASAPSGPNYTRNALLGFVLGTLLICAYLVIRDLVDVTIRSEEDFTKACRYPVLAAVPDMESQSKGGYYYGYGKKHSKSKAPVKPGQKPELVGGGINFAAAEAYKLLRTKLQFSFADENNCRVIGVSSALTGEGKSLSSTNLAYTTAQLGKRVLLIDCDMRRPSLADKLPIRRAPGLSDYLTGQISADQLLQPCGLKGDENAFHVISSGRMPPNPMELLSSVRMERLVQRLREMYDYVIFDLPPVGEVGDALAAAKLTDGILVVVRQNYCDTVALNAAVRQFEFVGAKILGIVFNCTVEESGRYGHKYYKRYYKRYYKPYYRREQPKTGAPKAEKAVQEQKPGKDEKNSAQPG